MLTKAEEEAMSSAYIAQLLAQDDMAQGQRGDYYHEYSNEAQQYETYRGASMEADDSYEDDEEEDYNPKKKSKTKKAKKDPRGRKRKAELVEDPPVAEAPSVTAPATAAPELATVTPSPAIPATATEKPTKRPKKPLPEGMKTGVYTDDEEKLFLEGMHLHGRNWQSLAKHMGTRDANSIRSHAQKYFIKLYRDNLPLPDKVRESGEGYTLSGKPLDPNSASAKPYLGLGPSKIKDTPAIAQSTECAPTIPTTVATNGTDVVTTDMPAIATPPQQQPIQPPGSATDQTSSSAIDQASTLAATTTPTPTPKKKRSKESVKKESSKKSKKPVELPPVSFEADGRTSYASRKLRRPREPSSKSFNQLGQNEDQFTMVKCEPFIGKPGSNTRGCQPFEMSVHSNVLLTMDFHAHLMTTEIIGFLAGTWDKTMRRMVVKEAHPCRSLNTGQNDVNVEMDPTSALETRQLIEDRDMVVVGWYHSHPTFIPDPSLVDIENQSNYQMLCRDHVDVPEEMNQQASTTAIEPFVGAIVGPYDPLLPGSASVINWFHVESAERIPKRLVYELQEDDQLPDDIQDRLLGLLDLYQESGERVNFAEHWRQSGDETKLEKVIKSLGMRMPWIQKKLKEQRDQMDEVAQLSETIDDMQVGDAESNQEAMDQDPIIDTFLEKVQQTLKAW
ncbi:hypothetical protein DM01DRAFT_1333110 [Hesseltinella vesiculosa]|uniref:Myb-like, SWIRM and MPN domain-containing protein 1 n=1 Tax=Hesseltinella vesiculosa TaxID=101127 RepID=A0A1X2GRE3_9FUNG|nr:hypothetical protein DM01DRAFT_1333110 [Hesseltinella vesiculosa]